MKKAILTLLILTSLYSCDEQKINQKNQLPKSKIAQTFDKSRDVPQVAKRTGKELFKSIKDTVTIISVTTQLLIENKWTYKPFDNCESYLKFKENGKGISVNCEIGDDYEMTYKIVENKIYVSEFDIPLTDNTEQKKIKFREDIFIYNGESLIMIDSKMYNIIGKEWIPEIEEIIWYRRIKN